MPVPLTSRSGRILPERILVYGDNGTGKTRAILEIARWYNLRHNPGTFHVISTEASWWRMLAPGSKFDGLDDPDAGNLVIHDVADWNDIEAAAKRILKVVEPHDWIVLDLISSFWELVQDHFVERVLSRDVGDFWEQVRQSNANKDGSPHDGWKDWSIINKLYRTVTNPLLARPPCHIYATAEETAVGGTEEKDERELFQRTGRKPVGQKHLPRYFDTIVRVQRTRERGADKFTMSTIKDRERELVVDVEVKDFFMAYLKGHAGWGL